MIPIRGRLQWEGATSASILATSPESPTQESPKPPAEGHPDSELIWTREALVEFWAFLLQLRNAGNCGPLSLSFHAVPSQSTPSMEPYSYVGSHKQTTVSMSTSRSMSSLVPGSAHGLPTAGASSIGSPLRMVDHIKLYHDARYTPDIRFILRAWAYKKEGQKIRLLRDSRLVLVDERSRGILMC